MDVMTYHFHPVLTCEMCGAPNTQFKMRGMRLNRSQGRRPKEHSGIAVSVKQCRKCGLIFSDPQPVPASINDHYGVPTADYWKPRYFEPDPSYFVQQIQTAKELIGFHPGTRALDIGAGVGKAMQAMARAGFDVYGIEPSASFRDKAIEVMGADPKRLHLGTVEDADFPAQSFDFITFGAVLEHLYSPAHCLERALSWLKPTGVMQVEVPSAEHFVSTILNFYYCLRGTNYVTNLSPMHGPFHLHEFTLKTFHEHGKRAGYTVARHRYDVASIYNLPRIIHPLLRKYMERSDKGMQLTVWLRPTPV